MILAFLTLGMAISCAPPETKGDLLPQTPQDWRFERLDFPLSFAPELKYDGFEELGFAPGMFNAASDTYFTYIFAMQITNEVKWDAKKLKELLETYYRGLCKTVAKETEFKIDESKIVAVVREEHFEAPRSRRFQVTVDCYDPFVTGKPLKLNIALLLIDKGPKDYRIFATVSPKPPEHSLWKILNKLEKDFREKTLGTKK